MSVLGVCKTFAVIGLSLSYPRGVFSSQMEARIQKVAIAIFHKANSENLGSEVGVLLLSGAQSAEAKALHEDFNLAVLNLDFLKMKELLEMGVNPQGVRLEDRFFEVAFDWRSSFPTSVVVFVLSHFLQDPDVRTRLARSWVLSNLNVDEVNEELLDLLFTTMGTVELGDSGQTLLYKMIRRGDISKVDLILESHRDESILSNSRFYITESVLADCAAETDLQKINKIPFRDFAYPYIIAQNQCNTIVTLASGQLLTLKHTDAKEVYQVLDLKRQQATVYGYGQYVSSKSEISTLEFYLNRGHSFVELKSKSYQGVRGFYTNSELQSDLYGKAHSEETGMLKLQFPISDQQAEQVQSAIEKLENSPGKYYADSRNCVDVAVEIFKNIGVDHPFRYFTWEQMTNGFLRMDSNAVLYGLVKYRIGIKVPMLQLTGISMGLIALRTLSVSNTIKAVKMALGLTAGYGIPMYRAQDNQQRVNTFISFFCAVIVIQLMCQAFFKLCTRCREFKSEQKM